MIRAVIFDVDGTLVDSVDYHARAWQEAFRAFGVEVDYDEVRSQIGKGGDQLLPVFLDGSQLESLGAKIEAWRGERYRSEYLPRVRAFPRVRELVLHLRELGVQYALATSAPEKELVKLQEIAQIEDLIDFATSKDDADRSKPHPDIFEAALAKFTGVAPEEVAVIGDSPFDAIAAGKLSLRPIGVLCGGFSSESLREAGCEAIFRDPQELLVRALADGPDSWLREQADAAASQHV